MTADTKFSEPRDCNTAGPSAISPMARCGANICDIKCYAPDPTTVTVLLRLETSRILQREASRPGFLFVEVDVENGT